MTRTEHLAWAICRALNYVEFGEFGQAFDSIASDLAKHPDTSGEYYARQVRLGLQLLMMGELNTAEKMREFILGFR